MFRMALNHLYGIKTYSIYGDRDIVSMGADGIIGHYHDRINIEKLAQSEDVSFVKTHNKPVSSSNQFKAIHIVRDGRDALTSYAYYMINVNGYPGTPSTAMDRLLHDDAHLWGGWSGHARTWIDWPGEHVTVKYEDMTKGVTAVVHDALTRLDLHYDRIPGSTMPSFGSLNHKWPKFFRSGQTASWKGFMTANQLKVFWARHMSMMRELDYV